MSVVDEIKARLDIVDVISEYVALRKSGRNFVGFCPFHHNVRTPSFSVFTETQTWHCFGACGTGGDVFSFVMRAENLDFSEALQLLARKVGVDLRPRTDEEVAEDKHRQRLREIIGAAAQYFHNLLLNSPAGERAREYLVRRRVAPETVEAFQLGFALDSWDALKDYLTSRGYSLEDVHEAGLIIERQGGGHYDRFRGRLMIPIRDERGRTIGFGGRVLGDDVPKYINSPQTPIFDKGHVLFGLDMARRAIRREGSAVITEGYMDVITAHQHGFKNVVASLGTALTEDQVRLLKRFTRQFCLSMDADAAGSAATLRGLDVVKEAADRQIIPVPTWRGLISYESRLDADISIITLPKNQDPDEVIRRSPDLWERLVSHAVPIMDYYFTTLTSDLDLGSAKGKAQAAQRLMPVIKEIGDPVEQTHYVQKLARLIRVNEDTLLSQLRTRRPRAPRQSEWAPPTSGPAGLIQEPSLAVEEYLLWSVMQEPRLLRTVQNLLVETDIGELDAGDFTDAENREIFTALQDAISHAGSFDMERFRDDLEEPLRAKVDWLLSRAAGAPPIAADALGQEAVRSFLRVRKRSLHKQVHDLGFVLTDAHEAGDAEAVVTYGDMISRLKEILNRVERTLSDRATITRALSEAAISNSVPVGIA